MIDDAPQPASPACRAPRAPYAQAVDAMLDVFGALMLCCGAAFAVGDLIRRYRGLDAAD